MLQGFEHSYVCEVKACMYSLSGIVVFFIHNRGMRELCTVFIQVWPAFFEHFFLWEVMACISSRSFTGEVLSILLSCTVHSNRIDIVCEFWQKSAELYFIH